MSCVLFSISRKDSSYIGTTWIGKNCMKQGKEVFCLIDVDLVQ
jgi:hypothetical protein